MKIPSMRMKLKEKEYGVQWWVASAAGDLPIEENRHPMDLPATLRRPSPRRPLIEVKILAQIQPYRRSKWFSLNEEALVSWIPLFWYVIFFTILEVEVFSDLFLMFSSFLFILYLIISNIKLTTMISSYFGERGNPHGFGAVWTGTAGVVPALCIV